MIRRQLVAISERRGYWASQLRGRLQNRPAIWKETRGTSDLLDAVEGWPCPIVVLDIGSPPREALERLVHLSLLAPTALVLALDQAGQAEVRELALSLGATSVWSGFAPPPKVASLVAHWLTLAQQRTSQAGRAALPEADPDPNDPLAWLGV